MSKNVAQFTAFIGKTVMQNTSGRLGVGSVLELKNTRNPSH